MRLQKGVNMKFWQSILAVSLLIAVRLVVNGGAEDGEKIRVKRQANPGPQLTCTDLALTSASKFTPQNLSNVSPGAFRDCPSLLNVKNYTFEQLAALAQVAITQYQDPSKWTSDVLVNVSIVVLGLTDPQVNSITYTANSILSLGQSLYHVPGTGTKFGVIFGKWRTTNSIPPPLNSTAFTSLQGVTCGCGDSDLDGLPLGDLNNVIQIFSKYNCYKLSVFSKMYNFSTFIYSIAGNWTPATVKTLGTIVAGVPPDDLVKFTTDKLVSIVPSVFAVLPYTTISNFTSQQLQSLTTEQLLQISNQLKNMTADKRDFIIALQNNRTAVPPASTTAPPKLTTTQSLAASNITSNSSAVTTGPPPAAGSNATSSPNAASNVTAAPGAASNATTAAPNATTNTTNTATQPPSNQTALTASTGKPVAAAPTTSVLSDAVPATTIIVVATSTAAVNVANEVTSMPTTMNPSGGGGGGGGGGSGGVTTSGGGGGAGGGGGGAWGSVTIPPIIDSTNIQIFLSDINNKLSTSDVQKIDPNALARPDTLEKLLNNQLDCSMQMALTNKMADLLANNTVFNPLLYAIGKDLIPPKRLKSLTDDQVSSVVSNPSYIPDPRSLQAMGDKLGTLLNTDVGSIPGRLQTLGKAISGVSPSTFNGILNKQKITKDFIQNFNTSLLTEKQSRDLYSTFLKDSSVDPSKMNPAQMGDLIKTLPTSVCQSIQSDDLKNLDKMDCLNVLRKISDSRAPVRDLDLGYTVVNLPSQNTLYDQVNSPDMLKSLTADQVIFLINNNLLTPKGVKDLGTSICPMVKTQFSPDNCATVSSIYEMCKTDLAQFCRDGILAMSSGFLTASDIQGMDDKTISDLCAVYMCPRSLADNAGRLGTIVQVLSAAIDKNPALIKSFTNIPNFLPYLKTDYFNALPPQSIPDLCSMLSCNPGNFLSSADIMQKFAWCIQNNVTLKRLSCVGADYSLFFSNVKRPFLDANLTCDVIKANLDVLQTNVIDCAARDAVYACVSNMDFTTANNAARLGTLIDKMVDTDFSKIPKKFLCGQMAQFNKIFNRWSSVSDIKTQSGFKPINGCKSGSLVFSRLVSLEASADCSVGGTRKKRQATTLTCSTIKNMAGNIVAIDGNTLGTLSDADFNNCVNILGRVQGFSAAQWQALATVAKRVFGITSKWTNDQIVSAAGIVTGLSAADVANLVLSQIEAVSAIGNNGLWQDDALAAAFTSAKANLFSNNINTISSARLKSVGEIICGAGVPDLVVIPVAVACDALQNLGKLKTCDPVQQATLVNLVKNDTCLGSNVANWKSSDVQNIGNLIGGLTKNDLSQLSSSQIQAIPSSSIPYISILQFNGFTAAQLSSFSTNQAACITADQLQSLDSDKQQVIKTKLASINSEIALSLTGINDNEACALISGTLLPIVTILLSLLMRI